MGVGLHQTRQRDASIAIQNRHAVRCRCSCNAPCQYYDIREFAPKRTNIADEQVSRHRYFPSRMDQSMPVRHTCISSNLVCCPSRFFDSANAAAFRLVTPLQFLDLFEDPA